jgi:hypothetical protein
MADLLIRIPHRVVYDAPGPVAVSDIIDSLQGVERLLQECGPIFEACFEGVTVERIEVSVEEISQHSPLKEMFWAAVIVVAQTQLEKDMPVVLEDLLGVNLPPQYDSILAFIFVVLVFYGARGLCIAADRAAKNVLVNRQFDALVADAAARMQVPEEKIRSALDERYGKSSPKALLESVRNFFRPSQNQGDCPVQINQTIIDADTIRELPDLSQPTSDAADEISKIFNGV